MDSNPSPAQPAISRTGTRTIARRSAIVFGRIPGLGAAGAWTASTYSFQDISLFIHLESSKSLEVVVRVRQRSKRAPHGQRKALARLSPLRPDHLHAGWRS